MSQVVGQTYRSRIPTFGDDASIEEALRVYHYGVDNYSTQPIPTDSIEGNFISINNRVNITESSIATLSTDTLKRVSLISAPNIITAESVSVVPLTVKAIASQTSNLQQWQNASSISVAAMSTGGYLSLSGYISVGSISVTNTVAANITINNSSHKGIVVKSANSQVSNLQEWQDSSGTALSWVEKTGSVYSKGSEVQTISPFLFMP